MKSISLKDDISYPFFETYSLALKIALNPYINSLKCN